ncbi:MAG: outer membrane beta-barrel protein [Bacteroidaceae bacterium]
MNMKSHIILFLLSFVSSFCFAQQLYIGSVRDGFLKVPLVNARVTLLTTDSLIVQDSLKINLSKREGERWGSANFCIKLPKKTCKYLLRASLDGYEDAWQTFSSDANIDDAWGLDPLELRRIQEKSLREAKVTATRLKMYNKGDTLVYDATAFKMPEGSMLDDLIRQMPGVTMNDDGEIFVNGRKVEELLLGSRSFMSGKKDVLLENLPYYTVKNVKVYEKETDRNRALGYNVEERKYVMDVNLKEEYRNGHIGNVEASGGTKERWLGRAFLLGFTDRYRFTLLTNANNVNEKRHIEETGQWKPENMPRSLLTTKSIAGEMDYQSKNGNVKENLMIDFMTSKNESETRQHRELFLTGCSPYSNHRSQNISHETRLFAKNSFKLTIPNKIYTDFGMDFEYKKYDGNSSAISEDFIDELTTRLKSNLYNEGHSYRINLGGFVSPRIDNFLRNVVLFYGFNHSEDKNEYASKYVTEQFVSPSNNTQYNANDFVKRETNGNVHLIWYRKMSNKLSLEIQDRQEIAYTYNRDNLYHPDTLLLSSQLDALKDITDSRNSYKSDYWKYSNAPIFVLKWRKYITGQHMKLEYLYWDVRFSNIIRSERLRYTRNNETQDKKRTNYDFVPSFSFKILPTKKEGEQLQLKLMYEQSSPSMFDLIDYRDDSKPQTIKLGNPQLKGMSTTSFNLGYSDWESKYKGQVYHIKGTLNYHHRQVAQSVIYNIANSQYVYQPKNVSGAYDISVQYDFTRFIDKKQKWSWQTTLDADYNHSVDHVMLEGMTESAPNAVNTTTLHDAIWLQYQKNSVSIRATGDIRLRHSEGKMTNLNTLNAFDYHYGITTRYTIPTIKTTVSIDGKMYSRRGYGSASLNTDDFVLNASLSQPFMKGKLIARIEAFDLLHQLSSTQYEVNAQGRTETWYRSLPNYVMLHLVYHWNKNPKKR